MSAHDVRADTLDVASPALPPGLQRLLELTGLAAVSGVLASICIAFSRHGAPLAAMWPVNAVILTPLLRVEARRIPALFLAGLAGVLMAALAVGENALFGAQLVLCDGLEIALCAAGLRSLVRRRSPRIGVLTIQVFTVFAGPILAGVAAAALVGGAAPVALARSWILTHGLGLILVAPPLFVLTPTALRRFLAGPEGRRSMMLLAGLTGLQLYVFVQFQHSAQALVLPLMVLGALCLETTGGALGMLMASAVAQGCLLAGYGPILALKADFASRALTQQLNLAVTSVTVMALGAVTAQRRRMAEDLAASLAEARAAHHAAEESERRTRLGERVGGVGYWRLDAATRAISWSPAMYRIYGVEGGEPLGLEAGLMALHPDDRESSAAILKQAIVEGYEFEGQSRIIHSDGSVRMVMHQITTERSDTGAVVGLLGAMVDITKLSLADSALRASEARFRQLTEGASDLIFQCDLDGRVVYVSPSITEIAGYGPEALIGRRIQTLIAPESLRQLRRDLVATLRARTYDAPWAVEFSMRHKDGRWLWLEAKPRLQVDVELERLIGVSGVARDITARKRIEAELDQKRIEAEAAALAKGEFMATMSHEIRTPLNAIVGFAGLLRRRRDLDDEAQRYLGHISAAGDALLDLVNDILDFSNLDAGQMALDPQAFMLEPYIREVVDRLSDDAAAKGLAVTLQISPRTPARVTADRDRLGQVLLNLTGNALKFTDLGAIDIRVDYDGGRLRIEVADTGPGIPLDRQNQLFRRFSQIKGAIGGDPGGAGLGLAISKGLVELMGGEIGLTSAEGAGATFWFTIVAPEASGEPDAAAPISAMAFPPRHLLVVDDGAVSRELIRALLDPLGFTFEEASSGPEAIEAALRSHFDLILMDLHMPDMEGLEAVRAIRARSAINRHTPILAVSANVLPREVSEGLAGGINDHIAKPIEPAVLLQKLSHWLADRPDEAEAPAGLAVAQNAS